MKQKKQLRVAMLVGLVGLCLSLTLALSSCTVVPKPVENNMAGTDSTVPKEYVRMNGGDNGGFLKYDDEKNGYISDGLKAKYNLLILSLIHI